MTLQPEKGALNTGKSGPQKVRETSTRASGHLPKTLSEDAAQLTDDTVRLSKLSKSTIDVHPIKDSEDINKQSLPLAENRATHSSTLVQDRATEEIEEREYTQSLAVRPKGNIRRWLLEDPWLIVTILASYISSVASFWYFFRTHQIVLYGDTYAHMLITRRVFDNATPGLAQLGGVWLPLPHLVMLPFIWNNYLWQTGLAGTIPSMICYLIASVYIFLSARRLTKNSIASFIGTLLFILNPNILYLQTTALSEIVLIATLTAASYYFLAWVQEDKLNYLILSGFATLLATLSRYDGWFLYVTMLILIIPIGVLKRHQRSRIEGNLILFGSMGGLGIVLWFAWCLIIFGNPLYFQNGPFSSQAQQKALIDAHVLFTYHDLWQSLRYYTLDSMLNLGPALFVLGVIAVVIFVWRRRISAEMLASLAYLSPFAFYVISLFTGQGAVYVPGAVPANFEHQIYNARYGVEVIAPAAVFIATLVSMFSLSRFRRLGQIALVGIIIAQSIAIAIGGIISVQDGQYGLDCAHPHTIIVFLAQHYGGGKILEDLYDTKIDALNPEAQIDFKNIIYEGSGQLWKKALREPASMANWIIVNPANPYDLVTKNLTPTFNAQFTRDIEESSGLSLYHRNGLVYPTRPVPGYLVNQHSLCVDPNTVQAFHQPTYPNQNSADRQRVFHATTVSRAVVGGNE